MIPTTTAHITARHSFYVPLERQVVEPLDGEWRFRADPEDLGEAQGWFRTGVRDRICSVPSAWQFLFDDLRDYRGPVWLEREITVAAEHEGRRLAVVFCGVDHYAAIWVNGRLAATHEGDYLPFAVDISELVLFDQPNRLTVRAVVPEGQLEIPGDETGQGHRTGIWRPVWLEVTGTTYVSDIHVVPDIDTSTATVHVEISAPALDVERDLTLTFSGPNDPSADAALVLPASASPFAAEVQRRIEIADAELWTLDNPQLYRLPVELGDGQRVLDQAAVDFGMRKIDIDGIHLRLNNKPIYLMGAMDPQDIPDKNIYLSPYHAPTDAEIKNEVVLAKKMGFNCIRKHHQIDDHRYLKWADRLGLLVYGQPPCYRRITAAAIGRFHHLLEGWVRRDRNHPSWIMWTLYNAAQGLQPMPTAYDGPAEPKEQAPYRRPCHREEGEQTPRPLDPTAEKGLYSSYTPVSMILWG